MHLVTVLCLVKKLPLNGLALMSVSLKAQPLLKSYKRYISYFKLLSEGWAFFNAVQLNGLTCYQPASNHQIALNTI